MHQSRVVHLHDSATSTVVVVNALAADAMAAGCSDVW
jgi:hypothetical protein